MQHFNGMVWSTPLGRPSQTMWHMHAPTFNKWHENKKKKKVTLHILTHGTMWGCGLNSLVVCINDKICDIRKRNVTIRSEIWTTNIPSLEFRDLRGWVALWRLILFTNVVAYLATVQWVQIYYPYLDPSKYDWAKEPMVNFYSIISYITCPCLFCW